MENRLRRAALNVLEVLECRKLLASISGTIIEDLDGDGSRDGRETGQAGVTVFLDQNRNRQFDSGETFTTTDAVGRYQFDNLAPGQYFVAQLPKTDFSQTSPGKGGFGNYGGDFHIQLEFARNVSPAIRSIAESAAARWEKVLVGDLPPVLDDRYGEIDDIVIEIFSKKDDGFGGRLAFAGPDEYRPADDAEAPNLPYLASATFDTDDAKNPSLFEIAVHEIGHALGFTLFTWFLFDDVETGESLIAGTVVEPEFRGPNATREYNALFGTNALGVHLQDYTAGQGSSFSHFSEPLFGDELMTPFIGETGSPMSRITIGVMEDIGYKVDYRGAAAYDPSVNDLPPGVPETSGGGLVDFSYTVTIEDAAEDFGGKDFMSRINRRPTLDALKPENKFAGVGDIVRLRALGPADLDSGDSVTAVQFYLENNNIDGLQLGDGGDLYIGADENPAGGFRFNARTGALGEAGNTVAIGAGTHTFYARPLDELLAAGKTRSATVDLFDADSPPNKPTAITASARSSSSTFVSWNDRSNNEFGFRLERSRDPFFRSGVQRYTFDANVTSFVDTKLDAASEYFYRVRSFNVGGKSSFAGPASTITLAPHEVIVDDADRDSVSSDGAVTISTPQAGARGDTYTVLSGPDSIVRFAPQLTRTGSYYVYAVWEQPFVNDSEQGSGVFSITDIEGETRQIRIDQTARGRENSEVLLGQFDFRKGNRTVVRLTTGDPARYATIDQLRFVPIG